MDECSKEMLKRCEEESIPKYFEGDSQKDPCTDPLTDRVLMKQFISSSIGSSFCLESDPKSLNIIQEKLKLKIEFKFDKIDSKLG